MSPVQYGTYTMLQSANGFAGLAKSKMPSVRVVGPSPTTRLNAVLSGAQVCASKHAPPPSIKNITFAGLAVRVQ
jgi:hypothetical protein